MTTLRNANPVTTLRNAGPHRPRTEYLHGQVSQVQGEMPLHFKAAFQWAGHFKVKDSMKDSMR
ncbi:hypothetical protein [Deinococcus peraridilitoris]|uniref:hypothetical protein n=1 Tax=Deinococcus peraridilitoris TaxID=432329 RepID=UPI0002D718D6|nr:hypothetical protein [Deinococcus peraridilitoris]